MPPTLPNEPGSSSRRLTRNRKLDNMENPVASNSKADKTPSVLDLFSKQLAKRKKIINEVHNEPKVSDPQYEVKKGINENITVEFDKENHNPQINQDQIEEHAEKRTKVEGDEEVLKIKSDIRKAPALIERCEYCRQKLDDEMKFYQGHPNGAVEEQIALIDPKLCLFTGDESFIHESDERPQNKITYFRLILVFIINSKLPVVLLRK